MFGDVLKIMLFETKLYKSYLVLHAGPTGTPIKIRDHFSTCFDVMSPLAVLKLSKKSTVEQLIFEVSPFTSFCVSF